MSRVFASRLAVAAVIGGLVAAVPAGAQEISQSHLAAAIEAVTSARTSKGFDDVLPLLVQQIQNRLIRVRPDLHKEIVDVVEEEGLKLAGRRAELDNDIARIWAKAFSEEELHTIATFYKSPAGAKLASIGPKVVAESLQAAKGWSDRLGEELMDKSREGLKTRGIDF